MTTPTKKRVVKTPGQRLHQHAYERGKVLTKWNDLSFLSKQDYESDAADLGIQPLTEDVPEPPKTDGELLYEAARPHTICGVLGAADDVAAEFLRLRAERDGEPLDVTKEIIADWYMEWRADQDTPRQSEWFAFLAAKINAHRGVRPVPQVTAEMLERVLRRDSLEGVAESLNAELAKLASQPPQPAPVAQPVERPEPVTYNMIEKWRTESDSSPLSWWNFLVSSINAHFGAGKVGEACQ